MYIDVNYKCVRELVWAHKHILSVSMYRCMYVYKRIYVYVCMIVSLYLYMYVYVGIHVCVREHVWVLIVYLCLYVCVGCVLQCFGPVWWDPSPASGDPDPIRIRAHCGPDTQAIRRPAHAMICRSIPVHAAKTRSETASFHVSVRSCAFPYYRCRYAFTCYTYHFMWLSIIFYQFDYLYLFMRHLWLFTLIT